jgi:hypothetical protein
MYTNKGQDFVLWKLLLFVAFKLPPPPKEKKKE